MIKQLSLRHCVFLAALISAATLAGALVSQYVFGLHPCDLCLKQRVPHVVVMALGVFAVWRKLWRPIALAMIAALLIGVGIALFHVGVEAGIFDTACSGALPENASLEDIRAAIANAPLVSCAQAMGTVLGLSLAAWNALISFGSAALLATMVWKEKGARMIRHIVFFSLKKSDELALVEAALTRLGEIPESRHFEIGRNMKRDSFSTEVDLVVYAEFADEAALARYKAHSLYAETIAIVRPRRELRLAADIKTSTH